MSNTINLIEKFANVVIDNASRISETERDYCEAQQELYNAVLEQQRKSFLAHAEIRNQDEALMQSARNQYGSSNYERYYSWEFFKLDKDAFARNIIETVHNRFISQIMDFFKRNRGVEIESPSFKLLSGVTEPELDDSAYYRLGGYRNLSDEQKAELKKAQEDNERRRNEYYDSVINATLNWNDIVDHIFVELGGCSFEERAEQEIIENCKSATWGRYRGAQYEVKNKRISFSVLYAHKGWSDRVEVRLDDSEYLSLLRALTYFDTDKALTDVYPNWMRSFVAYQKDENDGIFDTHVVGNADFNKVLTFRYFKNGKFEVGFVSAAAAQEFADTYCRSNGDEQDA